MSKGNIRRGVLLLKEGTLGKVTASTLLEASLNKLLGLTRIS